MCLTLDPLDDGLDASEGRGSHRSPVLEIVFHSDLSRIGATTAPEIFTLRKPVVIGRDSPLFSHPAYPEPHGTASAPLADPCVSREQVAITAVSRNVFAVAPASTGRRPVQLMNLDGTPLPSDAPIRSGTLIAIGDRVMLLLTHRRDRAQLDRMGLVGESEAMWSLRNKIRGAAASDGTVLVHGESGVGKELVARSIHNSSHRRAQRQVVVNCAAIPENLLESELFGHVRGAFTGANSDKEGFFKAAGEGSVFLDEVGELPLSMQGKLLRVLQERKICPVGGVREEPVQARVVAATNRDLRREISEGRFREDLYYRLTTLTIEVPPLRQRPEDVMRLFQLFLRERAETHAELRRLWRPASQHAPPVPMSFARLLLGFHWPGNVRHLRNIVEKTAVANIHSTVFAIPDEVDHELTQLYEAARPVEPTAASGQPTRSPVRDSMDETTLLALLEEHDYVQSRVARAAGVSHTTVDRWMRELGLRRPRDISQEELEAVAAETGNDLVAMARSLKVSRRGLKLRLASLGLAAE